MYAKNRFFGKKRKKTQKNAKKRKKTKVIAERFARKTMKKSTATDLPRISTALTARWVLSELSTAAGKAFKNFNAANTFGLFLIRAD